MNMKANSINWAMMSQVQSMLAFFTNSELTATAPAVPKLRMRAPRAALSHISR
jgi:hypothetical protein